MSDDERQQTCPVCGAPTINFAALAINYQCGSTLYDGCQGNRHCQSNVCRMMQLERVLQMIATPKIFQPGYATPIDVVRATEKLARETLEGKK